MKLIRYTAVLLLAACGSAPQAEEPAPTPTRVEDVAATPAAEPEVVPSGPALSQDADETGVFSIEQGGAIFATESFARWSDRLEAELDVRGQATIRFDADLEGDETISRLEVMVFEAGNTGGEPLQTSAATFDGGQVSLEQPIGQATGETQPVAEDAIPYMNPSPSFMEQILRRARAKGGAQVSVPVWVPTQEGGQTGLATVAFDGNDATITLGGVRILTRTDAEGRLLSGSVPAQQLTIERR